MIVPLLLQASHTSDKLKNSQNCEPVSQLLCKWQQVEMRGNRTTGIGPIGWATTQQQDPGDFQNPAEDLQEAPGLQGSTQTGRNTLKICLFYVSEI